VRTTTGNPPGAERAGVFLLLPAYEAEASVGEVLRRTGPFRGRLGGVVVVDDGSRDHTAAKARAAGAEVVVHAENRGKGAALVTGFRHCLARGAKAVVTMDADGQHYPEDLPTFFSALDRDFADIVVGSRRHAATRIPRRNWAGNRFATAAGALFTGAVMDDLQCGFRLYTASVLRAITPVTGGFATESEYMIRAHRRGFRVRNVDVRVLYDATTAGRSHYRAVADSLAVFQVVPRSLFWWD